MRSTRVRLPSACVAPHHPHVAGAKRAAAEPPPSAQYRCRAAYKLLELDDVFHLFDDPRRVRCVLDLAAAPGSFTQVAIERMQRAGAACNAPSALVPPLVVAVDLQAIRPLQHCVPLRCNVMDHGRIRRNLRTVLQQHQQALGCNDADVGQQLFSAPQVVLHDAVSVVEGQHELSVTYAQNNMAMGALRLAVDVFQRALQRHASTTAGNRTPAPSSRPASAESQWAFVTKALPSVHHNRLVHVAQQHFHNVTVFRPQATRADSRESYVVAVGFRGRFGGDWTRRGPTGLSAAATTAAAFSLPPHTADLRHGRQVMWHCFGCTSMRMGTRPCPTCGCESSLS